jgi:hypothetical protein
MFNDRDLTLYKNYLEVFIKINSNNFYESDMMYLANEYDNYLLMCGGSSMSPYLTAKNMYFNLDKYSDVKSPDETYKWKREYRKMKIKLVLDE